MCINTDGVGYVDGCSMSDGGVVGMRGCGVCVDIVGVVGWIVGADVVDDIDVGRCCCV